MTGPGRPGQLAYRPPRLGAEDTPLSNMTGRQPFCMARAYTPSDALVAAVAVRRAASRGLLAAASLFRRAAAEAML